MTIRGPGSEKVEIVQLVPVLKNSPLNLRRVHPRNEVFHVPVTNQSPGF